jgi:tryptophan-rich sensory protein
MFIPLWLLGVLTVISNVLTYNAAVQSPKNKTANACWGFSLIFTFFFWVIVLVSRALQ